MSFTYINNFYTETFNDYCYAANPSKKKIPFCCILTCMLPYSRSMVRRSFKNNFNRYFIFGAALPLHRHVRGNYFKIRKPSRHF